MNGESDQYCLFNVNDPEMSASCAGNISSKCRASDRTEITEDFYAVILWMTITIHRISYRASTGSGAESIPR
ncbi:hypothetical protein [Kandleria sp.]|uniref:hypothetical protein n=1 Tax=Kandleria sp. TaxID=2774291 RepID=UPI001B5E155E|nr:hypothetical protein [Kandleria sp.]MBP3276495.1 hypothetical protein [Kandleria sp.]